MKALFTSVDAAARVPAKPTAKSRRKRVQRSRRQTAGGSRAAPLEPKIVKIKSGLLRVDAPEEVAMRIWRWFLVTRIVMATVLLAAIQFGGAEKLKALIGVLRSLAP